MTDINVKREQRLQFSVEAEAENSSARACTFKTLHNQVQTPVFMPVATFASIRSQSIVSVDELEFPVLLANTYHLLLRPGTAVFKEFGGIHPFMNWKRSILTDSGGYQVFSLAKTVKITEEGAAFRSYLDGNLFLLSPETSIETQRIIGSDIMMVMDQCVASTSPESVCREAADITARWAERSLAARGDSPQSVFGIVQGACSPDLRKTSARQITSLPFDGYAIGGLAVGETEEERKDITEMTAALLPRNYPRYLMGVGTPLDLLEAVHRGVDMFDCILPTALGQQGVAYTTQGRIELRRGVYKLSTRPLDENCTCVACTRYTRGYLHHLIKTKEHYGSNLVGLHNLTFYRNLMNSMREHILAGDFFSYYKEQREALARDDEEYPAVPPVSKKRKNKQEQVLGAYKVIRQGEGFHSILHKSSGEIMHSVNDPLTEARALYVKQAGLKEMLTAPGEEDVVIWDVGLGAATNVMATLFEYEKIFAAEPPLRGLKIISFENDLDSLRLAVRNPAHFHHIRHAAPAGILKNGRWESPRFQVEWELLEGDFSEKMETADKPHCIYYDPFSLKTNGPLWSFPLFERIYQRCASPSARLFTYSNSTRVRSALLAAGFYVGEGVGTGPKASTTVAMSSIGEGTSGIELLGSDWLQRFGRSTSKWSEDASPEEKVKIEELVQAHPQFVEKV